MSTETPSDPIHIVGWNIHGAVGRDRTCDPDRIVQHLRRLSPDILALQEVDGRAHFGRRELAFEHFTQALGPHVAEARLVRRPRRDYGHLLWSRWPIERQAVRLLPGGRFEPRAAIDAVVATPLGRIRVLAAHFGLLPPDRRRQAEALATWIAEEDLPTVAIGDFNEWGLSGPVHRWLAPVLPVVIAPRSWPASRPFARMDRLYASGSCRIAEAASDPDAGPASDHLPLSVRLFPG